jgi:hypothetical protein
VLFSQPEADGAAQRKSTGSVSFRLEPRSGSLDGLDERDVLLAWTDGRNADIGTAGIPVLSDGVWTVPVSGIDAEGTVTVTLSRNGYEFKPASIENVEVHYAEPVTLTVTPADGDELTGVPTTTLTLAFAEPVANLGPDEITVTDPDGTGAKPGELKPVSGTNNYTLAVSGVTKSGTISVTVAKGGYDVTGADGNAAVPAKVYDSAQNPLATGGTVKVTKESNGYYETHTFTTVGTDPLAFKNALSQSLTAQVLVVAGGGGAGGGGYSSSGAGAGGMVENDTFTLSPGTTYSVEVGNGGSGGASRSDNGVKGGNSVFGSITAYGGGESKGRSGESQPGAGSTGGSTGGGSASASITSGTGGNSYGNKGGAVPSGKDVNFAAGGGGAGSAGTYGTSHTVGHDNFSGSGRKNSITGAEVIYAKGGPIAPYDGDQNYYKDGINGADNTGNGGGGAWNGKGGNGGSGIVVVRFPIPSVQ